MAGEPPTEHKQAAPPDEENEGWQRVLERRRGLNKKEKETAILWGAPLHTDPLLVAQEIKDRCGADVKCRWRGEETNRHLVVDFGTQMARISRFEGAQKACKEIGLKPVNARNWFTRERHRKGKAPQMGPPTSAAIQEGRYNPIAIDDEAQEAIEDEAQEAINDEIQEIGKGKRQKARELRAAAKCLRKVDHLRLKMGCINIRGDLKTKIGEVEEYAIRGQFDMLAIQEARLPTGGKFAVKGYKAFLQSEEMQSGTSRGGVVLLVANHLAAFVSKETCTTRDQLWVRVSGSKGKPALLVCCAYMLQESESKENRTAAFDSLKERTVRYVENGHDVLILGDLNAKLGTPKSPEEERRIGKHGEQGNRSGNGKLVVQLLQEAKLINVGGQESPEAGRAGNAGFWYTRKDEVSKQTHAIDFALVSERAAGCNQD